MEGGEFLEVLAHVLFGEGGEEGVHCGVVGNFGGEFGSGFRGCVEGGEAKVGSGGYVHEVDVGLFLRVRAGVRRGIGERNVRGEGPIFRPR